MLRFLFVFALGFSLAIPAISQAEPFPLTPALLQALQPSTDSWAGWLRCRACQQEDWARYGLKFQHAIPQDSNDRVVIFIHGFNSKPWQSDQLAKLTRAAGLTYGAFSYPNDQPISASAKFLSAVLNDFEARYPGRQCALVTHSMGGLVARECLENEQRSPGNVDRLIMIAPPNQGSMLANYAVGLDVWEHWLRRQGGSPAQRVRASLADGLSEAPTDLCPHSEFLTQLNARQRARGVEYSILLGSRAQLSDSQRYLIRQTVRAASHLTPGWDADSAAVDQIVAKLDEVIEGRGDGAVAVSRGRLRGVKDTHVLPFSHLSVLHNEQDEVTNQVHQCILKRLTSTAGT